MKREEAINLLGWLKCKTNRDDDLEAIDMAIEALSKPNYETDTEVRLAVTNRKKEKVILWDAFGEVEYYPHGDMYCPNCGVRLVPENEYLEPTQTHGRLIDADALSKKLCETTIFIKDGGVFQRMINDAPTVQAEAVHKPDYSYEADMARRLREETLKNKLQELAQSDDYEMAHREADELLCDFITKLGYGEVAQKFDAVPKWYA